MTRTAAGLLLLQLILLATIAAFGLASLTRQSESPKDKPHASENDDLAIRRELAALRRAVAALTVPTGQDAAESKTSAPRQISRELKDDVTTDDSDDHPGCDAPIDTAEPLMLAEHYRTLTMAERRDPTWAAEREQTLQRLLETEEVSAGYAVASLECRQNLCVVDLRRGQRDHEFNAEDFRDVLIQAPFIGTSTYVAPTEDGAMLIVTRAGVPLPAADGM